MKFRSTTGQPVHLALTSGHTAVVTPEGTELDPVFHRAAVAEGCLPEGVSAEVHSPGAEPTRKDIIVGAMNAMLDGKDEKDFNADGRINLARLNARLGFTIAREEADAVFEEITADV